MAAAGSRSSPEAAGWAARWPFWGSIVPLVALDLWSKAAVFAFLHDRYAATRPDAAYGSPVHRSWEERLVHQVFDLSGFRLDLVCWRNTGTIWGLGQDSTALLIALRCVALGVLLWIARRTPASARVRLLVLGAVFAGAVGNLYDNFFEPRGGVRDFLRVSYEAADGSYPLGFLNPFPAFNVADACISVGVVALALLLWREDVPAADRGAARRTGGAAGGGAKTGADPDGRAAG